MFDERWDSFVIYVNAYYAVQEAYDSARRNDKTPAEGLGAFCRDANPFLWDHRASAEEKIYESFCQAFEERFDDGMCIGQDGYAFSRGWLHRMEGDAYGTSLVAAFDQITDEFAFMEACEPIARQVASRATRLERTPQDLPESPVEPNETTPNAQEIEAVIALLAHGDEAFAQSLRERLQNDAS